MPIYDRSNIPDSVGRGTLDAELEAWLPSGPTLGADVSSRKADATTPNSVWGRGRPSGP